MADPFVLFTVKGEPAGWRLSELRGYQPRPHRDRTGTYLFLPTGPALLDQDPDEVARLVHEAEKAVTEDRIVAAELAIAQVAENAEAVRGVLRGLVAMAGETIKIV